MSDEFEYTADEKLEMERQWWVHPVTQELFQDLVGEHATAVSALRGFARDTGEADHLARIKYSAGVTDAYETALGMMRARDGEREENDK